MTDLDGLRAALREPAEPGLRSADLGAVMAAGSRLRRRRRLLTGAGSAAVVAFVVAGCLLATAFFAGRPGNSPAGPAPQPSQSSAEAVQVIHSGITDSTGEVVFFVVPVNEANLPDVRFGVMAGHRAPGGTISSDVETNEVTGSASSPGFHATEAPTTVASGQIPEFGYYAGAATRITGTVNGVTVDAHQAPAPGLSGIVVFWFDGAAQANNLKAFDGTGQRLAAGDATVGAG